MIKQIKNNKNIVNLILGLSIIITPYIVINNTNMIVELVTGKKMHPNFIIISATVRNNTNCEVWIKNNGLSDALDLKYYIKDEISDEYTSVGFKYNYTIKKDQLFLITTRLDKNTSLIDERSFIIKFYWLDKNMILHMEQILSFKATRDFAG